MPHKKLAILLLLFAILISAIVAATRSYVNSQRSPSQLAIRKPASPEQASSTFPKNEQVRALVQVPSSAGFADGSSTIGPDTSNWQSYHSDTCGFTLKYPIDWILSVPAEWGGIPASGSPTRCESAFGLGDSSGDDEISFEIEPLPLNATATHQAWSLDDYLKTLTASTSGSTYVAFEKSSIEGRELVWLKACSRKNLVCSTIIYLQNIETLFEIDVPGWVVEDNTMISPILGTFHFFGSN